MIGLDKVPKLFFPVDFQFDLIVNVGPVKTGDKPGGIAQAQFFKDVPAGDRIGCGRQGDTGYVRKPCHHFRQPEVFRSEIMPPLGYAVGLVDGKQGQGDFARKC